MASQPKPVLTQLNELGAVTSQQKFADAAGAQQLAITKLAVATLLGFLLSDFLLRILSFIVPDDKVVQRILVQGAVIVFLVLIATNLFAIDSVRQDKRALLTASTSSFNLAPE